MSDNWRVQCDCGYTVEGLTEDQARRCSNYHADDEHEPEYAQVVKMVAATGSEDEW